MMSLIFPWFSISGEDQTNEKFLITEPLAKFDVINNYNKNKVIPTKVGIQNGVQYQ